jgi:hypothetical protein
MRKGEACTGFRWGNLRKRDQWGRPRLRWEDQIQMDLQEVRCMGMDWIGLLKDRDSWWTLVNAVMKVPVP